MSEKSLPTGREQFRIVPGQKANGETSIMKAQYVGRVSEISRAVRRLPGHLLNRGVEYVADQFGLDIQESVFLDRDRKIR